MKDKWTSRSPTGSLFASVALMLAGSALAGCPKSTPAAAPADPPAKAVAGTSDKSDDAPAKTAGATDKADDAPAKGGSDKADAADDGVPAVKVETARLGTIEKLLPVSGTLILARDREAIVASPVAGVLDRFSLQIGDTVRRGDVIAHLSTAPLAGQIQQARAGIAQYDIVSQQASVAALQQQGQTRSAILQAQAGVSAAHANILAAQATLTADQATVANADQALNRAKSLFDQGLVAQKDVEAAELASRTAAAQSEAQKQVIAGLNEALAGQRQIVAATEASRLQDIVKHKDVEIARAQRANAAGSLASTQSQISLYTIRAPISGVVTVVNAGLGESVDTSTKIVTIANIDRLKLNLAVPSASTGALHVGQPLTFGVDSIPNRTFRGTVAMIGTEIDPANGTLSVIADVDNRDHLLKDDSIVHAGLVMAMHPGAVVVPRSAVFFDTSAASGGSSAASVLKLDFKDTVHKLNVTVGFTEGNLIEITSGLKAGDRVASTGGYGVADGTKVKPTESGRK